MGNLYTTFSKCFYSRNDSSRTTYVRTTFNYIYTDNAFRADRGTKVTKVIGSVFIISTLLAILTPSKNTLIAMYIANHATPENILMLINTFIK